MDKSKIVICVPYFGGKDDEHCTAIEHARAAGYGFEKLVNHPYIDQARCILAERALQAGAEVVLFIDHDIVFSHEDILPMALEAHQRRAVISGLYLVRTVGGVAVVTLDPSVSEIQCFRGGGIYPAEQLPGGFTAIPRAILEEMPIKSALLGNGTTRVRLWFFNDPLWIERDGEEIGIWGGEDMRFSQRARDAGYPLFVDTRPRLLHKGSHKFALEDGVLLQNVGDTLNIKINRVDKQIAR